MKLIGLSSSQPASAALQRNVPEWHLAACALPFIISRFLPRPQGERGPAPCHDLGTLYFFFFSSSREDGRGVSLWLAPFPLASDLFWNISSGEPRGRAIRGLAASEPSAFWLFWVLAEPHPSQGSSGSFRAPRPSPGAWQKGTRLRGGNVAGAASPAGRSCSQLSASPCVHKEHFQPLWIPFSWVFRVSFWHQGPPASPRAGLRLYFIAPEPVGVPQASQPELGSTNP